MKRTVLMTGANGFVGFHILEAFHLEAYHNGNLRILKPTSRELNLLNFEATEDYLQKHKPTTILHLAAKCAGILGNKQSPGSFLYENTQMALNIYEAARLNKITNIYSLGSVCAYPKHCPVPFKEDDIWNGKPEETNFPYSQAKRTLLMLEQTYREQYGFTGCHFIPANMYGEKDKFDLITGHVIPALIQKFDEAITSGRTVVECFGSGKATRSFLYGKDAAEVIVGAVMTHFDSHLPINLGPKDDISIKELAYLVSELMGFKGDIVFLNEGMDGQPKRLLDVSRAKELLNWETKTDLRTGLQATIDWYRSSKRL